MERFFVGLFRKRKEASNASVVAKADGLAATSEDRIKVQFWDVTTAGLW